MKQNIECYGKCSKASAAKEARLNFISVSVYIWVGMLPEGKRVRDLRYWSHPLWGMITKCRESHSSSFIHLSSMLSSILWASAANRPRDIFFRRLAESALANERSCHVATTWCYSKTWLCFLLCMESRWAQVWQGLQTQTYGALASCSLSESCVFSRQHLSRTLTHPAPLDYLDCLLATSCDLSWSLRQGIGTI